MWTARQRRVLTTLRERSGKRQHDIAVAAGLTTSRYINMEKGETALPAEYIPPIAVAAGISPDELLAKLGLRGAAIPPEDEAELRTILNAEQIPPDDANDLILEVAHLPQPVRLAAIRAAISLYREAHPD